MKVHAVASGWLVIELKRFGAGKESSSGSFKSSGTEPIADNKIEDTINYLVACQYLDS